MLRFSLNFVFLNLILNIAYSELKVADIFSSHMVLQSGESLPIWGWSNPGDKVKVSFKDQEVFTTTNKSGQWRINLEPEKVSLKPSILKVSSNKTIQFKDVLVGEVWYASGQSNMDWKVKNSAKKLDAVKKIASKADYPFIRYREINTKESLIEKTEIGDGLSWTVCNPINVQSYSAVCFFTALKLYEELKVPIGIIESAWGGHPIEPFIPESAFENHPVLKRELKFGKSKDFEGLKNMVGGVYARNESWLPGTIYNSRIAPIAPYAVKGGLWYQAESNSGKGEDPRHYEDKMKALMNGWREAWNKPEMPIYYVQLPQYDAPNWVRMREEQRRALSHSNTGMAVIIDLLPDGIHPPNKIDVADRLALWPLAKLYEKDIPYSGPMYSGLEIKGSKVIVSFDYVESGLVAGKKTDLEPTEILSIKEVEGFEVFSEQGKWLKAMAVIVNNKVECRHPNVKTPLGVRYAWGKMMNETTIWNLYNKSGLPASPFISDIKLAPFKMDE